MQKNDHTNPEWLRQKYIDEGLTTKQIAYICGISHKTVSRWLIKHGIQTRDRRTAQMGVGRRDKLTRMLSDVRDYTQGQ